MRCGQCRTVFDAIGSLAYVEEAALNTARPVRRPEGRGCNRQNRCNGIARDFAPARRRRPRLNVQVDALDRKRKALGPATTLRIAPGAAPGGNDFSVASTRARSCWTSGARCRRAHRSSTAAAGVPTLMATECGPEPWRNRERSARGHRSDRDAGLGTRHRSRGHDRRTRIRPCVRATTTRWILDRVRRRALMLVLLAAAQLSVMFRSDLLTHWPGHGRPSFNSAGVRLHARLADSARSAGRHR